MLNSMSLNVTQMGEWRRFYGKQTCVNLP